MWWIDTFSIRSGQYYRYHVNGRNDWANGAEFSWSIPQIAGRPYVFALRQVPA